jgi:hypothetical protein
VGHTCQSSYFDEFAGFSHVSWANGIRTTFSGAMAWIFSFLANAYRSSM